MLQGLNLFPIIFMFITMGILVGVLSAFISNKPVRKRNTREYHLQLEKKGRAYEKLVAEFYRADGYTVSERGENLKRKDKGIDLIIEKDGRITFIQCKNWTGSVKADHKIVKEFFSNCVLLEKEMNISVAELVLAIPAHDSISRSAVHEIKRMQRNGVNIRYQMVGR